MCGMGVPCLEADNYVLFADLSFRIGFRPVPESGVHALDRRTTQLHHHFARFGQIGVEAAKKNLVKIPVLNGTVPHEEAAKFGGAEVFIKPASTGTGVVAGGAMRAVFESVGITDCLAKSKGSSNPHNLVKATILALAEMRDAKTVAQNRGVSLSKVFRG